MSSTLSNEFSSLPGDYKLNESKLRNTISYPWAPTTSLQKMGGSVLDENFIDVESEIKNITRPLSNDPFKKYLPDENKSQQMVHFDDGFFHAESTRLRNNAFELKGVGINRWEPLFFDPQKNALEPFVRNGSNTVLATLDQHVKECQ